MAFSFSVYAPLLGGLGSYSEWISSCWWYISRYDGINIQEKLTVQYWHVKLNRRRIKRVTKDHVFIFNCNSKFTFWATGEEYNCWLGRNSIQCSVNKTRMSAQCNLGNPVHSVFQLFLWVKSYYKSRNLISMSQILITKRKDLISTRISCKKVEFYFLW